MKKLAILGLTALFFAACGGNAQQTANVAVNSTAQNANVKSNSATSVSSHTTEQPVAPTANSLIVPKSETKTKWTQSGNPIDTTAFDEQIKQANAKLKANAKDEAAKKSLADAYAKRAMALTEARQYASAIGDFRKAAKLDPTNEEAKIWVEKIVNIYNSINRTYPAEGEEPPPLPFKKNA